MDAPRNKAPNVSSRDGIGRRDARGVAPLICSPLIVGMGGDGSDAQCTYIQVEGSSHMVPSNCGGNFMEYHDGILSAALLLQGTSQSLAQNKI